MLRVFIGYDHRQPVPYTVLHYSILKHASVPVSITPLVLPQLNKICGFNRQGLTPFTFSRFLVPYLCNYEGWGLFLDVDILLRHDIKELFDFADDKYALIVSKNKIRFEWASMMLFNNAKCKVLTPEFVNDPKNIGLHRIEWAKEEEIGDVPREWNHLVGYDAPRPDAKLVHYTQATPAAFEAATCEYAEDWIDVFKECISTSSWDELMGCSVHSKEVDGVRVPKFLEGDELEKIVSYKKAALKQQKEVKSHG